MYLYIITFPNGKNYVGVTNNLKKRLANHKYKSKNGTHANKYLQNAVQKYDWENLKIISADGYDDEIYKIEIEKIKELQTTNKEFGYNISIGGDSGNNGVKFPPEFGAKISERNKKDGNNPRKYWKSDTERKWLDSLPRGETHQYFGKHLPKEIIDKIKKTHFEIADQKTNTKIKRSFVSEIISMYESGIQIKTISKKYKVGWTTIADIVKGRTWKIEDFSYIELKLKHVVAKKLRKK